MRLSGSLLFPGRSPPPPPALTARREQSLISQQSANLTKGLDLTGRFLLERGDSGWMFFASLTSKPQVFQRDPTFSLAPGLPAANEKQVASEKQRSGFFFFFLQAPACGWFT